MNHTFSVEHAVKYGLHEAILIGNLQFWISKNRADKRHQYDERTWTYNTSNAFSELLPYFSSDAIDRIIKKLVKQEVIILGNYNEKPYDRTRWIAFVNEAEFLDPVRSAKAPSCIKKTGAREPSREIAERSNPPAKSRNESRESAGPSREIAESLYRTDINTDVNADNTPQPPTADAAGVCASGGGRKAKAVTPASPEFEAAWLAYPERPGNSKSDALKAWKARVAAGASEQAMLDGVKSYAAYCAAMKTEPRYVKLASTFFGPGNHYAAKWPVPTDADQGSFFDDMDHSNNIEAL